jgi:hypothetical protein
LYESDDKAYQLCKIRPGLQNFIDITLTVYKPEVMILWQGHLKSETHNSKKLVKYGILTCMLSRPPHDTFLTYIYCQRQKASSLAR